MIYSSLSCDELVRACAESGDAEAWQEFVCRFERLIGIVVEVFVGPRLKVPIAEFHPTKTKQMLEQILDRVLVKHLPQSSG